MTERVKKMGPKGSVPLFLFVAATDEQRINGWSAPHPLIRFLFAAFFMGYTKCGRWGSHAQHQRQTDARVIAVTPFALDGTPKEWGHTNWLQLDREGRVLGIYPMFEALHENR